MKGSGVMAVAAFSAALLSMGLAGAEELLAIQGADLYPVDGAPVPGGLLLVREGKLEAVGADLELPPEAKVVSAQGKVVVPAFLDASSALYLDPGERGLGGAASQQVVDGLRFDRETWREVLAQGTALVYVGSPSSGVVAGQGAVLRVGHKRGSRPRLLDGRAALCLRLGVSDGTASTSMLRLKDYYTLQELFTKAVRYRETWQEYQGSLQEYEQKLAEWEKKQEEAEKQGEAEEGKEEAKKPERPKKPKYDPNLEVLVRAVEKEMPVRIEAYRADAIRHAIRLAREFGFDLILEGAAEAAVVAEELAASGAGVVLRPPLRESFPRIEDLGSDPAVASKLAERGIPLALGTFGADDRASRYLRLAVSAAIGQGLPREAALRALTLGAAELLGVQERKGSLTPGKDADFLIFSGDPFDPESRLEHIYLGGKERFPLRGRRNRRAEQDGASR